MDQQDRRSGSKTDVWCIDMSCEGWVKIHRQVQENPLWLDEKFSRGQAWVDLILLANHKDSYFIKRGIKIDVLRGQCGWSELALSARWKWSRSKVRNFLKMLELEHQIHVEKSKVTQVVTVVNYEKYQQKGQQKDNRRTTEGQQKDTNKNEKNEKKKTYGTFSNVFLLEEELKKLEEKFNGSTESKINSLSEYMKSKGKSYKSHYATILNWARRDSKVVEVDKEGRQWM